MTFFCSSFAGVSICVTPEPGTPELLFLVLGVTELFGSSFTGAVSPDFFNCSSGADSVTEPDGTPLERSRGGAPGVIVLELPPELPLL